MNTRYSPPWFIAVMACLVTVISGSGVQADSDWIVYEDCTLIPNKWNDGDSFHVKTRKYSYIFRLYFVDTPETEDDYPDRVKQQAEYFGITPDEALHVGKDATRYTQRALSRPFTVYTKKVDARGNSKRKRYFAMIKTDKGWLSTRLVDEGLARIYGNWSELPDGLDSRKYKAKLRVKEKAAKRGRKGAWKLATP